MATTVRRRTTGCLTALRRLCPIAAALAVIGLLSLGAPSRAPDFVWHGPSGAASPVPRAAATLPAIARVLAVDYGLPLPSRLVARSYASRDSFARGLVVHAWLEPERAAAMAGFAAGIALPGALLLRDASADPTPDWIRLIAHELTHVAQIELAGGEGPAARWLGEGMAEWVAYGVLARTVPRALAAHRRDVRPAVCTAINAGPLELAALGAPEAFLDRVLERGARPTYQLAFHLVDELVRRAGFASVRAYYGSFRELTDPEASFEAAFGMSVRDFEDEIARAGRMQCPAPGVEEAPLVAS